MRKKLKKLLLTEKDVKQKQTIEDNMNNIENEIANLCADDHAELIKEHVKNMCTIDGSFSNNKMWNLRKKVFKLREMPMAKRDADGILITNPRILKKLTLNA